ncbi:class I SAM-dependent methyltransferase [Weissella cibaria]|uniref:class I SAM-dependent methyltransferase n=1 Tax=Weissella cibaria TaxID=137591 RepID=UPI000D0B42D6|nr:class I SAM-dependent methyltransferase [Weissella cibaria]AVO67538.1 class I SAM-dependent methyltransferase [Weissella cibaria]MBZ5942663.1 class I SAM-dependent methyltransferase [Weissella cibaria]MCB5826473.1 class I SAM-dependent methyltransferase [Weissella cibaria]MCB5858032.1 class I SAM-dependent methyltransferase [Weissella cibaria]MCB5860258.1 class I SAM-dependent methyltransferase [Weissella cibaria]
MFETIEKAVKQLQAAQNKLVETLDMAAIEALVIVFELMLGQDDDEWATLSATDQANILADIQAADFDGMTPELKRQVLQLLLVATMREDGLQANYQVTPDAIGMWVGFVVEQFVTAGEPVKVTDLTVGSGNLLATVAQVLGQQKNEMTASGVENDDTMLTIASGMAALLGLDWQLTLADAVADQPAVNQDVVIADLPVGYYPSAVPTDFTTQADDGLTYVHHLLIEQAIKALRPGGLAALIVPANLFESEQAANILKYLQGSDVFFQALLQFPEKLFTNEKAAKAILVLQRAGGDAVQATPVMLARTPELTNVAENKNFVSEITAWMTANALRHA